MSDVFTDSYIKTVEGNIVAITVTYDTETGEIINTDSELV